MDVGSSTDRGEVRDPNANSPSLDTGDVPGTPSTPTR